MKNKTKQRIKCITWEALAIQLQDICVDVGQRAHDNCESDECGQDDFKAQVPAARRLGRPPVRLDRNGRRLREGWAAGRRRAIENQRRLDHHWREQVLLESGPRVRHLLLVRLQRAFLVCLFGAFFLRNRGERREFIYSYKARKDFDKYCTHVQ